MSLTPAAARRHRNIGIIAAVITVAIWTSFIVIARAAAHKTLTPFDIAFVRCIGAGLVLLPVGWYLVRQRKHQQTHQQRPQQNGESWLGLSPISMKLTALTGILAGVIYPCLAYSGFLFAPAAHASVLLPGTLPLWTALIAFLLLGTPFTKARALGLVLIVGGDLLVGGASLLKAFSGGNVWIGDCLFLAAGMAWSTYTVLTRKHSLAAIPATVAITVFAVLTYVPVYSILVATDLVPSNLSRAPWSEILFQAGFQGIGSVVISGITFVRMVETFGPVRSTMITAIVPSLSAIAAMIFLGEPLGWNVIAGLVLVTIGILFGVRPVLPVSATR